MQKKKKGLDIIEKVTKIFIDNNFSFKWTLVGRNSNFLLKSDFILKHKKYFEIQSEINNYDEVYFPHTKLIEIYKKHNVYVNLARIESFGITIIEAIAADLPVISFNTKGANEIVVNNKNGFLIDKYEPLEMANYLMNEFSKFSVYKSSEDNKILHYDLELNTQLTLDRYRKIIC